jgi:hypothetical protein
MIDVEVVIEDGSDRDVIGDVLELLEGTALIEAVAAAAYARWLQIAQERLTKTRQAYIAGLRPPEIHSATSATIELESTDSNPVPGMIEGGMPPYDMKTTHLKGAPYRVIRFDHVLPGEAPAMSRTPLGHGFRASRGEEIARAIGRNVAKHAKRLARGERLPRGLAPEIKPEHVTNPYTGLTRRGAGFSTFRTMSENAAPDAWRHPGIAPYELARQVAADMDAIAPQIVDAVLTAVLGG